MAIYVLASFFLVLTSLITYYGYRVYSRPGRVRERLTEPAVLSETGEAPRLLEREFLVRVIHQLGAKVPISPEGASMARRYLMAAGYRSEAAIQVLYGCKVICCALVLVLAFAFQGYIGSPMLRIPLLAAAGFLGWFAPSWILDRLVVRRHERLRLSLPDALDLMVVCVEAGLGLDQAFVNVARELKMTHPEICEEFTLVNLEMHAGKRRPEALHNLADRTGESELQKLVAILIQSDRFGTSIAESLRTHADFMRIRRRQEAEERAGKVGVKLVFPIFFCILPSMLIVTAGPGLLQIIKYLFPMMRQFTSQH